MSTNMYSIHQFCGMSNGSADNLVSTGYAAEAENVDMSDGALQTLIGIAPYPSVIDTEGTFRAADPKLMWEGNDGEILLLSESGSSYKILKIYLNHDGDTYGFRSHGEVAYTPSVSEQALLEGGTLRKIFRTEINGEQVAIGLWSPWFPGSDGRPLVIGYENGYYIRKFGTGLFLTSDRITSVTTANSKVTKITIGRVLTDFENARCLYRGICIMQTASEELAYAAAEVASIERLSSSTVFTLKNPLSSSEAAANYYVRIPGGISDKPVKFMASHYGRLFAAGDPDFPNRLYWSCLPGDGRTIEDWSADDASPDTGGGYVDVGLDGSYITALFSFDQQLLIWCGDGLWRLYGASPSQYTLERVFTGIGQKTPRRDELPDESELLLMDERIASVNGIPYVLSDDGLWYYNGSTLQRADGSRTISALLSGRLGESVSDYGLDLSSERSIDVRELTYSQGGLYFTYKPGLYFASDARRVFRYDLATDSVVALTVPAWIAATHRGVLIGMAKGNLSEDDGMAYLLYGLNMTADVKKLDLYSREVSVLEPLAHWEDLYHHIPYTTEPATNQYVTIQKPIDAVWESKDLSFGVVSYSKKLRRIGLDVTGPIRVIVKTPEGAVCEKTLYVADVRTRRFEWLPIDIPYECTFRIRFESIDGKPFRIHNGVDFFIDSNQRN